MEATGPTPAQSVRHGYGAVAAKSGSFAFCFKFMPGANEAGTVLLSGVYTYSGGMGRPDLIAQAQAVREPYRGCWSSGKATQPRLRGRVRRGSEAGMGILLLRER